MVVTTDQIHHFFFIVRGYYEVQLICIGYVYEWLFCLSLLTSNLLLYIVYNSSLTPGVTSLISFLEYSLEIHICMCT